MIIEIAALLWTGISFAFQWVTDAFEACGLSWPVVVSGMAVMAALCRSFFQVWVGNSLESSMSAGRESFFSRVRYQPKHAGTQRTFGDISSAKGAFSKGRHRRSRVN